MQIKDGIIFNEEGKTLFAEEIIPLVGRTKKEDNLPVFETKTLEPVILLKKEKEKNNIRVKVYLAAKKNGSIVTGKQIGRAHV